MKKISLLLFVLSFIIQNIKAQKTHSDSIEVINAARRYSLRFRLSSKNMKKFQTEHFPSTSDYFKPDTRNTPDVLLEDSLFVKTYRLLAFNNALDQRNLPTLRDMLVPNHSVPGLPKTVYSDSIRQAAQKDARRFSLTKPVLIKFNAEHFPETSDYFKPVASNASSPAMLNDSAYVETFRFEAYNKSYHQPVHPTGHAFFIACIAAVSTALLLTVVITLSRVHYY